MRKYFYKIVLLLACFGVTICEAQVNTADTTLKKVDTNTVAAAPAETATDTIVATQKKAFEPNPKKAGMYSALLPGAGQFYDHKYWKIPVIYAGIATAVYFIQYNYSKYSDYHTAYINRISNPYYTDKYSNVYSITDIKTLQDDYKKYLDLTVLATGIGYVLQILDAVVYAYLKNFDVSRDISFHMHAIPTEAGTTAGLVVYFK